jgi:hypothetical protein
MAAGRSTALHQRFAESVPLVVKAADFLMVGFCTIVFALNAAGIATTLLTDGFAGQRDFLTYWCSGRQLVLGANPYDSAAIGVLERSIGYSDSLHPLVMRNAPYSLPLVYPLGFLSVRAASLLWSAMMLLAAWLSIRLIAEIYGQFGSKVNLLAYAFAPLLSCFISGQTSVFALLGLALFLRFHRERPLLAGTSLWLCALKPQNFVVFGVVLLIWCVLCRRWRIIGSAIVAIGATALVVTVMRPAVWHDYSRMMLHAHIEEKFIPCLSTALRVLIWPSAIWLQWVPVALGCCWAVIYFFRQRSWDWLQHGRLLLLVSVLVAPYSWFMDQTLFLAVLLPVLYVNRSSRWVLGSFALLSAGIETANLAGVPLYNRVLYPWTACMWVGWYLVANRGASAKPTEAAASAQVVTSVS